MKMIQKTIFLLILTGCFLFLHSVHASTLYFAPDSKTIGQDQEFTVGVFLDTHTKAINALEGEISWPRSLELLTVNNGDSIVPLWISEETNNNSYKFSGVIPGGFSGLLTPYSKDPQPGKILALSFKALEPTTGNIMLSSVKILLHDGLGTEDNVEVCNFNFTITAEEQEIDDELSAKVIDRKPPEEFIPEITWNEDLYDGEWALVFVSQDKGSGIDHYEVKEGRKDFKVATSPYLIKDQTLKSKILVKAVDKSGNERIVDVPTKGVISWYEKYLIYVIIIGVILIALMIFWRKR
ncbi:MAG: hypothetical protein V1865_02780 [bacterium]